jgi:glycosyltransferase involved in cell wall biosynthesis
VRILIVAPRYLPFAGGVELHADQVARRLAARGIQVTVLTTDPTRTLPAREEVEGVDVRRVRAWPAKRDYYLAPRIYSEITEGNWSLVHVQSFQTLVAPVAMLAARRSQIPYVLTFHGGGHSAVLRRMLRPVQLSVLRPLLARADRLIALAPFEVDEYSRALRLPSARFVVISNGSDLPRLADASSTRRDASLIASVGRLERYKGHHRVVEALPHLLQRRPGTRLWIAGSGPYEASLRKLAEACGVSASVEIRGVPMHRRAQMAEELSRVKVVVSLSEFETQPIAALESAALGCRLVVADSPGLAALAAEGLARAIPLDSAPPDVATAILEELDKPPIAGAPTLPTWDDCADALVDLYTSVLGRSPNRASGRGRTSYLPGLGA